MHDDASARHCSKHDWVIRGTERASPGGRLTLELIVSLSRLKTQKTCAAPRILLPVSLISINDSRFLSSVETAAPINDRVSRETPWLLLRLRNVFSPSSKWHNATWLRGSSKSCRNPICTSKVQRSPESSRNHLKPSVAVAYHSVLRKTRRIHPP